MGSAHLPFLRASAPPATAGAWLRPPLTSSIMYCPGCPCARGVLSLPKRLRYYLQRDRKSVSCTQRIFLDETEWHLRSYSPGAAPKAFLLRNRRFPTHSGPADLLRTLCRFRENRCNESSNGNRLLRSVGTHLESS